MDSSCLPDHPEPMKIILADDGSKHAQAAINLLQTFPFAEHTAIKVVGVVPPIQATTHTIWQQRLDYSKNMLLRESLQVSTELVAGYPAETLLRIGEMEKPDLMVLGAKGLRATLGILLGGVAQQIIEYGTWPLLIVRHPFRNLNTVTLATDGSPSSKCAENFLKRLQLSKETSVNIVHVLPPVVHLAPKHEYLSENDGDQPGSSPTSILLEEIPDEINRLMDKIHENLLPFYPNISRHVMQGDAATEILQFIQQSQTDLVVSGSRGLSQVQSWLLGSVSRKLVHYSPCSVLLVKGIPPEIK
jgi:nucleotide-binding universal stress UspA family protein